MVVTEDIELNERSGHFNVHYASRTNSRDRHGGHGGGKSEGVVGDEKSGSDCGGGRSGSDCGGSDSVESGHRKRRKEERRERNGEERRKGEEKIGRRGETNILAMKLKTANQKNVVNPENSDSVSFNSSSSQLVTSPSPPSQSDATCSSTPSADTPTAEATATSAATAATTSAVAAAANAAACASPPISPNSPYQLRLSPKTPLPPPRSQSSSGNIKGVECRGFEPGANGPFALFNSRFKGIILREFCLRLCLFVCVILSVLCVCVSVSASVYLFRLVCVNCFFVSVSASVCLHQFVYFSASVSVFLCQCVLC